MDNTANRVHRWRYLVALLLLSSVLHTNAQEHPLPVNPPTTTDTLIAPTQRKSAPNFSLVDSDGKRFTLADQRGNVVVLNFWATWCGGCKFELPYFVNYESKYHDRDFVILGISMDDEGFKIVRPFWTKNSMPYPTVIGDEALGKQLGLGAMPYTLLIDRQGRIAIAHSGVLDRTDFDHHIQDLLASTR